MRKGDYGVGEEGNETKDKGSVTWNKRETIIQPRYRYRTTNIPIQICQTEGQTDEALSFFILLGKSVKNKFLFTMTAYTGQTRMTLGQLCAALWDSQSHPDLIQPGIEPGCL